MNNERKEFLELKWGTLKGWRFDEQNEKAKELLKRYAEIGYVMNYGKKEATT